MWRRFQDENGYGNGQKQDGRKVQEYMGVVRQYSSHRGWDWWKMVMTELGGARMLNVAERALVTSFGLVQ